VTDADLLDGWRRPEISGEFNDFGVPYVPSRDAIEQTGLIGPNHGTLMVEVLAEREPVGTVSWRAVHYGPNPESLAWNIGIALIPEARGRGFGTEAQGLLVEHLFATSLVNRIEAMTDAANAAEQRSLEKAGFHREGVLVGAQFRAGAWHDLVVYSVVRAADPSA
jgi:RimJ/RimL family protein N-acetyltransferase